jgi:dissimilatory sulfite reductase related protein
MPEITIAGKTVNVDAEGYLTDYKDWTEELAREIAREEGIEELTERHLEVISFMRAEFEANGTGPSIRRLNKKSGVPTKELYQLFPGGPAKKAARIAGITKPQGCI